MENEPDLQALAAQVHPELSKIIAEGYRKHGKTVSADKTRLLSSTLVQLDERTFQIMASTFISIASIGSPHPTRPEVVSSTLTFEREDGKDVLRAIKVPALYQTR